MNGAIGKVTENLLRRVATRQGYDLTKSRGRDPAGAHYGQYQLTNVETGEIYIDAATGGAWMSAPTLARALDREDVMTNGNLGHVGDPTVVPVIGLRLVPKLADEQKENGWVVEQGGGGITATLVLSDEKARDLAEKILGILDQREQQA